MSDRFPGGVISKTPPTVVGPTDGEGGSASGVWTLDEVLGYQKAGDWPKPILPRELYAWGRNIEGQLGLGDTVSRSSPTQVGSLTDWTVVSQRGAIRMNGTLWLWGNNASGQVGDNTRINSSSPVQIGALTNWSDLSTVNSSLSGAIKTDGTLWLWGNNSFGQLGDGTVVYRSSPVQIGALTNWAKVSASIVSAAIKTDGTLWTWGFNGWGSLGTGDKVYRSSPVQVGALTNWYSVSSAPNVAAVKTDGTLWGWGLNSSDGGVGDNTRVNKSSPVQVGALTNWKIAVAGSQNTLALKTDGTLWSWGYNGQGQLGQNDIVSRSSPVQIGSLTDWASVTRGSGSQAFSAIKADGTLWAWGLNSNGQLGDGTTISRSSPVQVGSLTTWSQTASFGTAIISITKG